MSTSPVSPEDIRAAAEVHQELGPEYSDAVVASFIDKVEREVAARVEARLAVASRGQVPRKNGRLALVMGIAIGACAGGLLTVAGVSMSDTAPRARPYFPVPTHYPPPGIRLLPYYVPNHTMVPPLAPAKQP